MELSNIFCHHNDCDPWTLPVATCSKTSMSNEKRVTRLFEEWTCIVHIRLYPHVLSGIKLSLITWEEINKLNGIVNELVYFLFYVDKPYTLHRKYFFLFMLLKILVMCMICYCWGVFKVLYYSTLCLKE